MLIILRKKDKLLITINIIKKDKLLININIIKKETFHHPLPLLAVVEECGFKEPDVCCPLQFVPPVGCDVKLHNVPHEQCEVSNPVSFTEQNLQRSEDNLLSFKTCSIYNSIIDMIINQSINQCLNVIIKRFETGVHSLQRQSVNSLKMQAELRRQTLGSCYFNHPKLHKHDTQSK